MIAESNPFHGKNCHDLDTVMIKINSFFPDSTLNFKLSRLRVVAKLHACFGGAYNMLRLSGGLQMVNF